MAGGYAVKVNIFVQSNIVFLATVCIQAFGYSNVIALGNSGVFLSKLFNIGYTIIKILDIGLVLSNVCCILIDVSSVSCDICFVLIDISSVSCNVCFVLGYAVIQCCDICFILINIGSVSCNILIGLMQLAAVDSVSRGAADFACSYAADLAVLINGNLIVNLNIAAVQNDGGSAVGNLIAGYVDICQFCPLISIYAIIGSNVAGGFNSAVGTADVYIFASDIAEKNILIQAYFICLLAILSGFFYSNVTAVDYFRMFTGFLLYRMELTAIDGIRRICCNPSFCYATDTARIINRNFTKFCILRGNLTVIAVRISYVQFSITKSTVFIEYAIIQLYISNVATSCFDTSIFVYNKFTTSCIEGSIGVHKEWHRSIVCGCTYGQVVFGVQCVGLNGVYINVFVQLNLNLSAVMAYADVLVTAEINIIAGFYIGCFGCNTVGSEVPAHVSSCTYCLQLAYVYGVCITNACCNTGDTAILVYSYFIVDGCGITEQGNSCAFTVSQFGCCAVQNKACTVIANGFNAYQILVQFNLNSFNAVFCILAYADILVTAEVNIIIGFHIFCFGQNTVSSKFPSAVLQLAYIYSIIVVNACSYTSNTTVIVYVYFTIDNGCITKQFYRCALTISQFGCKTAQCQFSIAIADAFDANQILVQLNFNLSLVIAYADVLVAAEVNIFAGSYIGCFGCNTVGGQVPAFICICSYLFDVFQLAYIYSISIINAFSYVSDYFIVSIQAVFGDVSIAAKANAFFIIHEEVACLNAVNIKISVQFNINKSSKIGFFLAYGNIFIVTAEVNDITGFNFSRVGDFFPGGKIPACIFSCSPQLCYVYSIGSFAASCYIGNLTGNGIAAYRYSTSIGFPSKAVCTFRSKSTNNTGFCCSISN